MLSQEAKLKELVTRYSQFINFPIYLLTDKEVDVPIPAEELEAQKKETEEAKKDGERAGMTGRGERGRLDRLSVWVGRKQGQGGQAGTGLQRT